jgi:hypothetical protein
MGSVKPGSSLQISTIEHKPEDEIHEILREKDQMLEMLNKEKTYYQKKLELMAKSGNQSALQAKFDEACSLMSNMKSELEVQKKINHDLR